MKNKRVFFIAMAVLSFLPGLMKAQAKSAATFFNTETIPCTYLGIDFTLAKLVNDEASNATVIQSTQFNGINDLIVKENKKFDVQEAYHRSTWTVDLKEVEARNLKANPDQLKSTNEGDLTRLTQKDIATLVGNFNYGADKGYGVLLVMEGMSKTAKMATLWFTLIDMDAKKVLFTERVEGKLGSGFGFRNYWSSAIKNAINQFKKNYDQVKSSAPAK